MCEREHKSIDMFAFINKDGFVIDCFSKSNPNKKKITHKFEKIKDKTTKKCNRLDTIREFAE